MPLNPKEIKEKADNLELDYHFDIRLKRRNVKIEDIKYHLKNSNPIIKESEDNENKYKLSYQLEKDKYLTMYILNTQKGLKLLTVFIEKRIK